MSLIKFCLKFFSNTPQNLDSHLIYCFAHNYSCLDPIITTLKKYNIKKIHLINNQKKMSGVDIYETNKLKYNQNNISVDPIEFEQPLIHTKNESNAVVEYMIKNKIKKIILIAPVFHILRASLTFISTLIDHQLSIDVSSLLDNNCDWSNYYTTHQGISQLNTSHLIDKEIERITTYTQKGDIKPLDEIMDFITNNNIDKYNHNN